MLGDYGLAITAWRSRYSLDFHRRLDNSTLSIELYNFHVVVVCRNSAFFVVLEFVVLESEEYPAVADTSATGFERSSIQRVLGTCMRLLDAAILGLDLYLPVFLCLELYCRKLSDFFLALQTFVPPAHVLTQAQGPHVSPDLVDVVETDRLGSTCPDCVPTKRELSTSGPDRILLLVIYNDLIGRFIVFCSHGSRPVSELPGSTIKSHKRCRASAIQRKIYAYGEIVQGCVLSYGAGGSTTPDWSELVTKRESGEFLELYFGIIDERLRRKVMEVAQLLKTTDEE
jgi:hypothetical protein